MSRHGCKAAGRSKCVVAASDACLTHHALPVAIFDGPGLAPNPNPFGLRLPGVADTKANICTGSHQPHTAGFTDVAPRHALAYHWPITGLLLAYCCSPSVHVHCGVVVSRAGDWQHCPSQYQWAQMGSWQYRTTSSATRAAAPASALLLLT
jgi:hypothetical protein